MSLVLDCSVTLAWLLPNEDAGPAQAVLDRIVASRAWVPTLWRLEVANSLQSAVRRKRIDAAFRDASLSDLDLLTIQIDPDTASFAWSETLRLADTYDLTVYDAAYLELAQRLSLPLASQDGQLRLAAKKCSVALLGRHGDK
ncbi:PilT protein domain protein [mine drainage metagenome]|uniref:PilT protein domain protein n=1 Tax=mine drainage metagenome TaxID=410659 RepID=T0YC12_9ZZZZ